MPFARGGQTHIIRSRKSKPHAGDASPPPMPIGVPSARQQAAPDIVPSRGTGSRSCRRRPSAPPAPRAPSRELGANVFWHGGFDFQRIALGPDPWRFDRFLQAHAVVDQVDQRLHHARKDALSAGQAERVAGLPPRARSSATSRWSRACLARPRARGRDGIEQVHVVVGERIPYREPCSAHRTGC